MSINAPIPSELLCDGTDIESCGECWGMPQRRLVVVVPQD
jgi:hypothetical protein